MIEAGGAVVGDRGAVVVAVCRDDQHRFSKICLDEIVLLPGVGVQGDAHAGVTVQHRSRVAVDPTRPNLRQLHLLPAELFEEVRRHGFAVRPGQLGENVTTQGIDLLSLPRGALLQLGKQAMVQITGLRNPCRQINTFRPGLLKEVLTKDPAGELVRRAGVMGIVLTGGTVRPGDPILLRLPAAPHHPLTPV